MDQFIQLCYEQLDNDLFQALTNDPSTKYLAPTAPNSREGPTKLASSLFNDVNISNILTNFSTAGSNDAKSSIIYLIVEKEEQDDNDEPTPKVVKKEKDIIRGRSPTPVIKKEEETPSKHRRLILKMPSSLNQTPESSRKRSFSDLTRFSRTPSLDSLPPIESFLRDSPQQETVAVTAMDDVERLDLSTKEKDKGPRKGKSKSRGKEQASTRQLRSKGKK